jgi:hypothetical protein
LEKLVVIVIYANILSSVQKRNKGILLPIYRDLEKNLNNDYIFSYTAATLMLHETDEVMKRYLEYKDWDKVKDLVIEENIMQKQSVSSRKRVFAEIKRRIESLTSNQLEFVNEANSSDIRNLVFLSILKTYRFIFEFMAEVISKKVLMFDYKILNSDYETFFESKKYAVEQLENITEATQYKLKQVLFRILEEAMVIDNTKSKNILKPHLSGEVIELIVKDNPVYLKAFLYTDYEIEKMKERYL